MAKKDEKNKHAGHRKRLREKYINNKGLEVFSEHEILELLLTYSIPRANTNDLAHELIDGFINLEGVLSADAESLLAYEGLGESTAVFLSLIGDIHNYIFQKENDKKIYFTDYETTKKEIRKYFKKCKHEVLYAFFLNKQDKLVGCRRLAEGRIDHVEVDIPRLIKLSGIHKAYSVVLAHNHPGGNATPSSADITVTSYIGSALALVGVRLKDHYIISDKDGASFLDLGCFDVEKNPNNNPKTLRRSFLFGEESPEE